MTIYDSSSDFPSMNLYDHAGISHMAEQTEILEMAAKLTSQEPDAYRIRKAIALEALSDEDFRSSYNRHLASGAGWRENSNTPILSNMPIGDWGSEEMDSWIRNTEEVLRPKKRKKSFIESIPVIGNKILDIVIPNFVWVITACILFLTPTILFSGWASNLLWDSNIFGSLLIVIFCVAIGVFSGNFFKISTKWNYRALVLLVFIIFTSTVSFDFFLAIAISSIFSIVFTLFAKYADKQLRNWADEPSETFMSNSSWKVKDGMSTTRFGAATTTPEQAANVLRAWASRVGFPIADASRHDLVAAVIAADAWAFALSADSVSQAASFGPASLGAISAAISRASGFAEDTLPPLPGQSASQYRMPGLNESIRDWFSWATLQIGREAARKAMVDAASDLAWGGGGDDRLAALARTMVNAVG